MWESNPPTPILGAHKPASDSLWKWKNPLGHQKVAIVRCHRGPHGTNVPAEIHTHPLIYSQLWYLQDPL